LDELGDNSPTISSKAGQKATVLPFLQCWGYMTFLYGSGSPDPYLRLMDTAPDSTPDPTPFFNEFKNIYFTARKSTPVALAAFDWKSFEHRVTQSTSIERSLGTVCAEERFLAKSIENRSNAAFKNKSKIRKKIATKTRRHGQNFSSIGALPSKVTS
jgi:hypothetical protein